jgi:hypothetical protein
MKMREILSSVETFKVETELDAIYIVPSGQKRAQVNTPHLTTTNIPLQSPPFLLSTDASNRNLIQHSNSKVERFSIASLSVKVWRQPVP